MVSLSKWGRPPSFSKLGKVSLVLFALAALLLCVFFFSRMSTHSQDLMEADPLQAFPSRNEPLPEYVQIDAGDKHTCALTDQGEVRCWGFNNYGQTDAPDGVFEQIYANVYTSCAFTADGHLTCWGEYGVEDSTLSEGSFVQVEVVDSNACALEEEGDLYCWSSSEAFENNPPSGRFTQFVLGTDVGCGLGMDDGKITCWGDTTFPGGTDFSGNSFEKIVLVDDSPCALSVQGHIHCESSDPPGGTFDDVLGQSHYGCALDTSGQIECWDTSSRDLLDVPEGSFAQIALKALFACGVNLGGGLSCWGDHWFEQFGRVFPLDSPNGSFSHITLGDAHGCAITQAGDLSCWGDYRYGQLDLPLFDELSEEVEESVADSVVSYEVIDLDVTWNEAPIPFEIDSQDEFLSDEFHGDFNGAFYQMGFVTGGEYEGYEILMSQEGVLGGVDSRRFLVSYDQEEGRYVFHYRIYLESELWQDKELEPGERLVSLYDLDVPETLPFEGSEIDYKRGRVSYPDFSIEDEDESEYLFHYNGFEVRDYGCPFITRPDFSRVFYNWDVDFINDYGALDLVFLDGEVNTELYAYRWQSCFTNCTLYSYLDYIDRDPDFSDVTVNPEEDFVLAGYGSSGAAFYEFADPDHEFLIASFDDYTRIDLGNYPDLTYEEFAASRPFFFWQTPDGQWVQFLKDGYRRVRGMCKPVVYLYPEEPMDVRVGVFPDGGVTISEPEYPEGGWEVYAYPDGTLVQSCDGKVYDSLFWEAEVRDLEIPEAGFVVAQEEVVSFFTEKMTYMGFITPEIDDFLEYWWPRFQDYPYYFITFMDPDDLDRSAPLRIIPEPDTVIRMFMDYRGLQEPIEVEELKLRSTPREGFTVTEWGGAPQ